MIKNIYLGFNIFKKKEFFKVLLAYLLFGVYSFYIYDVIFKITEKLDFLGISTINYTQYLITVLGWNLLFLFLSIFGLLFFLINLTVTIANTESKKKLSFFEKINSSFKFTLLSSVVMITFFVILLVIGIKINILTTILGIFLIIASVFLIFVFYIANIYLGLENKSVKESLEKAREFFKRKFWITLAFLILLFFANSLIYFIIDFIYFQIFYYEVIAAIITLEIIYLVTALYSVNAFTLFIKGQKFK